MKLDVLAHENLNEENEVFTKKYIYKQFTRSRNIEITTTSYDIIYLEFYYDVTCYNTIA